MTALENFERYQARNFDKLMKVSKFLVEKEFKLNSIESGDVLMDRFRYIRERIEKPGNRMSLDFANDKNFMDYMYICLKKRCIFIKKKEIEREQQLLNIENVQNDHETAHCYVDEVEEMIGFIINSAFPGIQIDQGETK